MSLHSDCALAGRRLLENKVTSAAATLSLAIAIGACLSAFRLIDALLLRPLPIAAPGRLQILFHRDAEPGGNAARQDSWQYPLFREMRSAIAGKAAVLAVSEAEPVEIDLPNGQGLEKVHVQYVSGDMFEVFGLRPAEGRVLRRDDDLHAGGHPVAVLSHDFWSRRFAQDPRAAGQTFRTANNLTGPRVYQIVGVAAAGFAGTEPGKGVDVFLPSTMHWGMPYPSWSLFRTFVQLHAGVEAPAVREQLEATVRAFDRASGARSKRTLGMEPSPSGASGMQKSYRSSLVALGALAAAVLLIACANVANLMTARGIARGHEMAIRMSLGASRWRLARLALMEALLIGLLAFGGGWWFAEQTIPFVLANVNPPGNPVRLSFEVDWRVFAFAAGLALFVPLLFGAPSALRASSTRPAEAIKDGKAPGARGRRMGAVVAVQTAFCFFALHHAALFVFSFHRLSGQDTGFSSERLIVFDIVNPAHQPSSLWDRVADGLRGMPGVDSVAYADWPLLDGRSFKSDAISMDGQPPSKTPVSFLNVSPGWLGAMKIPFIAGRDFRATDLSPGAAIVNEAFVARFCPEGNPLGRWFEGTSGWMRGRRFQIVGSVRDARYRDLRQPAPPVAYTPFRRTDTKGALQGGTIVVRTQAPNALDAAAFLRNEIPRIRPEFRVTGVRTQQAVIDSQTTRERLLAMLAWFFGLMALLLASVGLYGMLDYFVRQRRREIGVRVALGAQPKHLAMPLTARAFSMVLLGAAAGFAFSTAAAPWVAPLLFEVRPNEAPALWVSSMALLGAAILAAMPALVRAARIDPAGLLRAE